MGTNSIINYIDLKYKMSTDESNDDVDIVADNVNVIATEICPVEKNLEKALLAKEKGNDFFRKSEFEDALDEYSIAISLCPLELEHADTLGVLYGNRAAAYVAEDEFDLAIEDCTKSLELKPSYVKVLFRRAQCYEKKDRLEDAVQGM